MKDKPSVDLCVAISICTLQFNTRGTFLHQHINWVNNATILEKSWMLQQKLTKSRKPMELPLYCELVPKDMPACDNKPNDLNP